MISLGKITYPDAKELARILKPALDSGLVSLQYVLDNDVLEVMVHAPPKKRAPRVAKTK